MDLLAKARAMKGETEEIEEAIEEVKEAEKPKPKAKTKPKTKPKPKAKTKPKPKINKVSLSVKKKTPIVTYEDGSEEKIPVEETKPKPKTKGKVGVSKKSKTKTKPKKSGTARIIGIVGEHGTGKTTAAASFGKLGKALYLDSEKKAHVVINEHFSDYDIDIISFRQTDNRARISKLKTVKFFENETPKWRELIASGKYKVCIIDNCDIFRPYAKFEWLRRNPKRTKPQSYEWGDIEEIVQDLLYPFINDCRDYDVTLILCFGTKDAYLNDVIIGTGENMKQWLLGELDAEIWCERDYQKYCIKHPYKPYWQYRDEGELLADYLFDNEHIENNVEFKTYNDFKEESLVSDIRKRELKQSRKAGKIQLK